MAETLKRKTFCTVTGLIFFSLLTALCPMDGHGAPKAPGRAAKQHRAQTPPKQERPATAEAEAADKGAGDIRPESSKAQGEARQGEGQAEKGNDFLPYGNYQADEAEPESYVWLIFKTVFVIGLLVGGFYYFFRFVTRKTGLQVFGKDVIQVLSVVPLGQNKYLQVVDLAGRVMVLGVTDGAINLITEITGKEEIDRIRVMSSRPMEQERPTFQDFLGKQLGRFIRRKPGDVSGDGAGRGGEYDRLAYLKRQRDRLRKMNGEGDDT